MRTLPVTNNAKGQQLEITLKLGLQVTEVYFPYIANDFIIIMKEGVSYLKFMLLILKLRSFLFVFVGDGNIFLKISQMLVVCVLTRIQDTALKKKTQSCSSHLTPELGSS